MFVATLLTSTAYGQAAASVTWNLIPPDSLKVSAVVGNVSGLPAQERIASRLRVIPVRPVVVQDRYLPISADGILGLAGVPRAVNIHITTYNLSRHQRQERHLLLIQ